MKILPFELSDINETSNLSTDIRKIFKYVFSWKSFHWNCQILMKLQIYPQIFEKYSNI